MLVMEVPKKLTACFLKSFTFLYTELLNDMSGIMYVMTVHNGFSIGFLCFHLCIIRKRYVINCFAIVICVYTYQ